MTTRQVDLTEREIKILLDHAYTERPGSEYRNLLLRLRPEAAEIPEIQVVPEQPPVRAGELEKAIAEGRIETPEPHTCEAYPVPYVSDGALGHGFECGKCGAFLQAG